MKEALACLDDEDETEVQFLSVSNYHLEDDDDMPVSFSALPIQWGDSESSSGSAANKDGKVFLHGSADNGLRKIFMQVTAWRFDLSYVKPKISLLSKDRRWIRLIKPRKSFVDTVRTILITLHFLHRVKKNPRTTATSLWSTLCKDKDLSSYGIKPSQKDLLDHLPLIGEAAKRDAVLAKSKLLLTVIGEKPGNQKLSHEDVKDLAQPGFIVDDIDNDMIDDAKEDSEAEDVCALCDNGGNLLCCDGACRRSFHATKEDGRESNCDSLGFTQKEVDEIQSYFCKNCEYHQHQCFACGKLGSSDKVRGAEVIKCASATCDRFYHPHCVAKSLPQVVKHVAEDLERNIADGHPFTCPIHYCCVCKELENKMEPELQFAVCRRCPKSYHRKCLPREIAFDDIDDEDIVQRAWEDLLPNNRILIYCLNHDIDDELRTPIRDYIKFPSDTATVRENNTTNKRIKPATKENVILKNNADLDNSSGKSTAKGSKVTGRLSSSKVGSKKSSEKMNSGSNTSIKLKSNEISRCLTGNKKSISKKFKMADCEENMPRIEEKPCAVMNKGSKQTKHDNQVDATVREINTTNKRMKPATKESITLKKNNIDLDNSSGKSTAKGSKVTGELSSSKVGSKKSSEKIISGSNTSSKLKSNEISRRRLTGNKKSISKKFKMADREENRSLIDEKLCAVMNKGSKRIKHDNQVDDVDGETLFVKPIRSELPPFGADSERSLLDSFKEARSLISLEGVLEKDTFASTHTLSSGNVAEKPITLGKMEGSADAHTVDGDYDDNTAMNHDLLESTGDQEDQASINESQKRSSHHGDFVEVSHKGQESRMSKPGKMSRKKKHKKNNKRGLGLASPAKRGAVNGVPKGVPDHNQPNPIDGRCPVEGFQPKSVMACAHEEDGNNDCGNLKPTSDSVSPLSDGGVTNIEEHHGREEEKCRSESDIRQQVSNSGVQDLVSTESDHLSGRDPNCGYMGYSHEQLNAVTDSSYKMKTPAMERYGPHVDELNHVKMSSLGSEPMAFSSNGTCEHRVPLPGFAPGPHPNAYSLQNSAGWLIE